MDLYGYYATFIFNIFLKPNIEQISLENCGLDNKILDPLFSQLKKINMFNSLKSISLKNNKHIEPKSLYLLIEAL